MLKRLTILGLVVVSAWGSAQNPVSQNGGKQQEHPETHADTAQSQTPGPSLSDADRQNANASPKEAEQEAKSKKYLEDAFAPANLSNWILAVLGIVGGIAAVVTLFFIKRQVDIMEQQAKDAQASGVEAARIALATAQAAQKSADAAEKSAIAAMDAINLSRDSSVRKLRAYIAAHQVGIMNIKEDEAFGVGFVFVNYGQTHALKFNFRGVVDLLPFPLPENFVLPEPPKRAVQDGVIFPKETNPMRGWVWERADNRLTVKEKLGLFSKDSKQEFYAHGTATYVDVFGIERSTTFCISIDPASVIRNQAGDIIHDKEGNIQFQFIPIANRNSLN
jgi:hypothetical protein